MGVRGVELEALAWLPKVTLAVALTAWTAPFVGLLLQAGRAARDLRTN